MAVFRARATRPVTPNAIGAPEAQIAAGASATPISPSKRASAWGFGLIGIGWLAGWILDGSNIQLRDPFVPSAGVSIFAVFYILAQAIERLLEPFGFAADKAAGSDSKPTAEQERDAAVAAALVSGSTDDAQAAANAQGRVNQIRVDRTVVLWGAATLLAAVGAAYLNLQLLDAVGFGQAHAAVELPITSLAVGGGTKPLHDLISKIQATKDNDQDPSETQS